METISIALICTMLGAFLSYSNFQRNKDKDVEEKARSDGKIDAKLDFISQSTSSLQADFKSLRFDIGGMNERLIKVEESSKSAHHRIDGLENKNIKEDK